MDLHYWWLIAGIFLLVVEIFSPSFFAASLGIGSFFASGAAFLGWSLEIQILIFALFSVLSIFVLRPFIKNHLYSNTEVPTNADALIGRHGIVVQPINKQTGYGRLAIDGDEWQFVTPNNTPVLAKGDSVRVIGRDSIVLTVEPI